MEKKLWFKAKNYGWGWQPSSWQGWVLMALYFFAIIKSTWNLVSQGSVNADLAMLAVRVVPPTFFLLVICYLKGERPSWRWGSVDEKANTK